MKRDDMLVMLDAILEARIARDLTAMAEHIAAGATFRFAGESAMTAAFSCCGAIPFMDAVRGLDDSIAMHRAERKTAIVEDNRVAALWTYEVSFSGRPPFETEVGNLWTFDAEGKVSDLTEFVDTAKLVSEVAALSGT